MGEGDPSPENVREIVGWDGVEQYYSKKNVGHIVGYSAAATINRIKTNTYGTTINTINYEGTHGEVVITQAQAPESSSVIHYKNGYIVFYPDNLIWDQRYNFSFRVSNIISNPLNATIDNFKLINPYGNQMGPTEVIGDRIYFKNILNKQRSDMPTLTGFNIRICGMSCMISDIMITNADNEDEVYEPYTDKRIVKWNQWLPPLTEENWQAYNTSNTNVTFEDGIAISTWLNNTSGYNASIRTKTGIVQKNKEIWYVSYMIKASMAGGAWGAEYNGGLQETAVTNEEADVWYQCSRSNIYWKGTRNYVYISYYRSSIIEHTGMVAQVKSPLMINLTQMFGAGNEPTKEEFEEQCILNGVDLTSALPYDEGSLREWKTNGTLLKNNITFPILGKNKFNINSPFAEPSNTNLTGPRIFQPYTYCLGLTDGNGYSPDKIIDCSITNNTLTFTTTNTSYGVFFTIPSLYGTYRLSYTGENVSPTFVRYDNEGKLSYSGSSLSQGIIAFPSDVSIAGVLFRSVTANTPTTVSNIQIEEGTAATEYEEFNPNHTVYGGWVDLITGEVQEEYKLLDKPWSEWGNKTTFGDGTELRYIKFEAPVKGNGTSNFKTSLCNVAKYLYGNENGTTHYYIVGNSYNCRVYLPIGTNEDTQIQVLGELVTPISYSLAPTQLQTFLGQNNVWSNADYVEVEYDLHETQDILARKQFIVANQPHIVKPAAAPLQNFTTDVPAPLKECKVYFEPVQDLHGYDKPWPAGGGKNIAKPYDNSYVSSTYVSFDYSAANGTFRCYGTASASSTHSSPSATNAANNGATFTLPAGTYTLSIIDGDGANIYAQCVSSTETVLAETTSYITFTTNEALTVFVRLKVAAGATVDNTVKIQLEAGSTATSYVSYENVCPISGWSELTVTKCGKNLLNINRSEGTPIPADVSNATSPRVMDTEHYFRGIQSGNYYYKAYCTASIENGVLTVTSTNNNSYGVGFPVRVVAGEQYTLSGTGTSGEILFSFGFYDKDWNYLSGSNSGFSFPYTITVPQNTLYMNVVFRSSHTNTLCSYSNIQLELGSTTTPYSLYTDTTIPLTFPAGKNIFDEQYPNISKTLTYLPIYVGNVTVTASTDMPMGTSGSYQYSNLFILAGNVSTGASTDENNFNIGRNRTQTAVDGYVTLAYRNNYDVDPRDYHVQIEVGSTATLYEPYGTIYGGYVDLMKGEIVQEYELVADTWGNIKYSSINSTTGYQYGRLFFNNAVVKAGMSDVSKVSYCNVGKYTWNLTSNATPHFYIDTMGSAETYTAYITLPSTTDDNLLITCVGKLINPIIYSLTPQQLKALRGTNNIWSTANSNIDLAYWSH